MVLMDIFTKTYLNIVNEWNSFGSSKRKPQENPKSYSLAIVAVAVKEATDNFKDDWSKGSTSHAVYRLIPEIEEKENDVFDEGQQIVLNAYDYWNDKNDEFAVQVKDAFRSMDCPSDKVGLFAYAIWQGMKMFNFNESNVKDSFKSGDKVELTLKCDEIYDTTFNYGRMMGFRNSYLNVDHTTCHYSCSCEKYPNIKFDVIFGNKTKDKDWCKVISNKSNIPDDRDDEYFDVKVGDVFKVSAKVKIVNPRYATVNLNFGRLTDIIEFSN